MLMQVQEAHTNPQTAAGDAALLNTNEPASNCYSIEGLNLGIESLGTETLSETFIRVSILYGNPIILYNTMWHNDNKNIVIQSSY